MFSNTLTPTAENLNLLSQRYDRFPVLSVFREGDVIYMTENLYIRYFLKIRICTVNFTKQV